MVWSHKNSVSYSVCVDPEMGIINYTGKSSAQLILLYNTKYNVSVVASLCGKNSTSLIEMNHGKMDSVCQCKNTLIALHTNIAVTCDQLAISINKSLRHRSPALVGTVATISCPSGLILTGPNVTICMANHHWELDPQSAMCKGKPLN